MEAHRLLLWAFDELAPSRSGATPIAAFAPLMIL